MGFERYSFSFGYSDPTKTTIPNQMPWIGHGVSEGPFATLTFLQSNPSDIPAQGVAENF